MYEVVHIIAGPLLGAICYHSHMIVRKYYLSRSLKVQGQKGNPNYISLKDKIGASMAPQWSNFHVHRMAPFKGGIVTYLMRGRRVQVIFFSHI